MSNPTPARNEPGWATLPFRHGRQPGSSRDSFTSAIASQKGPSSLLPRTAKMSALFNFQSLLLVILLLICTSAYTHQIFPSFMDNRKDGVVGIFWKFARVGERLSPYVSLACVFMAVRPNSLSKHTNSSKRRHRA
ncbi:hypothetical protein VDGL01_08279 [Verticillium dahliae]